MISVSVTVDGEEGSEKNMFCVSTLSDENLQEREPENVAVQRCDWQPAPT